MKERVGKGYGALLTGSSSPASVELGALQDCEARLDKNIIQGEVIRTISRRGFYQGHQGQNLTKDHLWDGASMVSASASPFLAAFLVAPGVTRTCYLPGPLVAFLSCVSLPLPHTLVASMAFAGE